MSEAVLAAAALAAVIPGREPRTLYESVDLRLGSGEAIAIVGRSGSGKSTLLATLGMLQPAHSGHLEILGVRTSTLNDAQRAELRNRSIGFVFQDYALVRELNVRQNLELPFLYRRAISSRERRGRVERVLEQVGMAGTETWWPSRLSGGEQQRIAIARAIITEPRIILADEPTGALDTTTGDEIVRLLRDVASGSGCGLVVVTHDPVVAEAADRTLQLRVTGLHPTEQAAS